MYSEVATSQRNRPARASLRIRSTNEAPPRRRYLTLTPGYLLSKDLSRLPTMAPPVSVPYRPLRLPSLPDRGNRVARRFGLAKRAKRSAAAGSSSVGDRPWLAPFASRGFAAPVYPHSNGDVNVNPRNVDRLRLRGYAGRRASRRWRS